MQLSIDASRTYEKKGAKTVWCKLSAQQGGKEARRECTINVLVNLSGHKSLQPKPHIIFKGGANLNGKQGEKERKEVCCCVLELFLGRSHAPTVLARRHCVVSRESVV